MVDTQHSKCCGESRVGSSPTSGMLICFLPSLCFVLILKKYIKRIFVYSTKSNVSRQKLVALSLHFVNKMYMVDFLL